jgi:hypothetical protein
LLLLLPFLLALACGGGGGGGGPTEPTPPPVTRGIVFTPASGGAISLAASAATTTTTLFLEVRANAVSDLYGAAFDLRYPNTVLRFVRATPGPFLAGASLQAIESPTGTVVIGISKLGSVPGATGSGVLMTLELQATATGDGTFSFINNTAIDSGARPLGLTWSAGTVRVTL